jgi:MFS transporter, DHA1 family, inner membrane transport protein
MDDSEARNHLKSRLVDKFASTDMLMTPETKQTPFPTRSLTTEHRGRALVMFCVLLTAYMLMAADRYLFPVLAPDVRREFGFSLADTGLLTTIFTLGLGLGGLPTALLLARLSRKSVLMLGIAIFSIGTTLTTVANGFWLMLLCLAATGIGMAMLATSMFALAASHFVRFRAVAIGSVNFCYGLGGFISPILATVLLASYRTWHAPMMAFGLFGFLTIGAIAAIVRPWFSETRYVSQLPGHASGAQALFNRNSILLAALCLIHGLSMYGFLGMYPTFLRENLHYAPKAAGLVMSFFGLGALASIIGGWIGDRFSPSLVLSTSFFCVAILGCLLFQPSATVLVREMLTLIYGVIGSAILYVNLAAYHVKTLRITLANRGSGMFVTSFYGPAAFGGYLIGAIAARGGWLLAGESQISLLCVIGGVLALALRRDQMAL